MAGSEGWLEVRGCRVRTTTPPQGSGVSGGRPASKGLEILCPVRLSLLVPRLLLVEWAAGSVEGLGFRVDLGPVPAGLGLLGVVVGVVEGVALLWLLPAPRLHLQEAPGTVLHLGALVMEEQAAGTDIRQVLVCVEAIFEEREIFPVTRDWSF